MTIDSEDDTTANVIRIGRDYQAEVPPVSTMREKPAPESIPEHAVLVWSPGNDVKKGECKFYHRVLEHLEPENAVYM